MLKKLKQLKKFLQKYFYPPDNIKLGKHGEQIARRFLKKQNYKILHKNWKYKHSEIDIIAYDKQVLVFIEVRLRDQHALVRGLESISKQKRSALRRACFVYLKKYAPNITTYRFDVIDIEHNNQNNTDKIYHFENIKLF